MAARKRKKGASFVPYILLEEIFFKISVLSQCIVYWINFQDIYRSSRQEVFCRWGVLAQVFSSEFCYISKNTFFSEHLRLLLLYIYFYISKTLLHTLFCLLLKWLKTFIISLTQLTHPAHVYTYCLSYKTPPGAASELKWTFYPGRVRKYQTDKSRQPERIKCKKWNSKWHITQCRQTKRHHPDSFIFVKISSLIGVFLESARIQKCIFNLIEYLWWRFFFGNI